jgi:predicted deacylase
MPTNGTLRVGSAVAAPGQRAQGIIEYGTDAFGQPLGIPVTVVNGTDDGPVLWVDGGIHGDEPEGPLAIVKVLAALQPAELKGAFVGCMAMNPPAFAVNERGNAWDKNTYDMNRIYPGRPNGFPTERIAYAHSVALTAAADLEMTIHSGGDHSYLSMAIFHAGGESERLAKAMGPGWDLLLTGGPGGKSPMTTMAEAGKAAITVELGGMSATLPPEYHRVGDTLAEAIFNVMRAYGMISGEAGSCERWLHGVQELVSAPVGGLWVPERDVVMRVPMREGDVIARIYDLFGNEVAVVPAPCDGQIFGLRTNPTVHPGDWCCFYARITGETSR